MTNENIFEWNEKKKILVILAHPDDPDYFCGATIANWCRLGHEVHYCLATKGQRGTQNSHLTVDEIEEMRISEQNAAAQLLGISSVKFLDYFDGDLVPDLKLREDIVKEIRISKPNILVTSDPQNLFPSENRVNHPDHRAIGQAVVDAVFPAAGSPRFFVRNRENEPISPHTVEELWLTLTHQPDLILDQTDLLDLRTDAIACHTSQLYETPEQMRIRMHARYRIGVNTGELKYTEQFKRIRFIVK